MRPLLTLLLTAAVAPAADPLGRIPATYTLAASVPDPGAVAALRDLPAVRSAMTLPEVQAVLSAGPFKVLADITAYYETDLGADWPTVLKRVFGHGLALGAVAGEDDGPTLVVAEGTDLEAVGKFFASAVKLVETAGDNPVSLTKGTHAGADTITDGKQLHAARRGPTLYLSNRAAGLKAALDHTGKSLADAAAPARALVGGEPLAWAWADFAPERRSQATADFFAGVGKEPFLTLVAGGTIDAARRAAFVAVGLHRTPAGLRLEVKLPSKRADLPTALAVHVPPTGPGTAPLLRPPGTLYTQSFHLDPAAYWTRRAELLGKDQLAEFEKAAADISKFLPNTTLPEFLAGMGPHHRLVVVDLPGDGPYRTAPQVVAPAAAVVVSMRDEKFGRTAGGVLRAAALAATTQLRLKMSTQEIDGVKAVCYRFREDMPLDADPDGLRFNAVPCFAVADGHLIVATRPDLIKLLLPELKKSEPTSPAVWRGRIDAAGVAAFLARHPEPLVRNGVLADGLSLADSKARAARLTAWLGTLGTAELTVDHRAEAFVAAAEWQQELTAEGTRGPQRKAKD